MSGVRRNVEQLSAMEGGSYDYQPDVVVVVARQARLMGALPVPTLCVCDRCEVHQRGGLDERRATHDYSRRTRCVFCGEELRRSVAGQAQEGRNDDLSADLPIWNPGLSSSPGGVADGARVVFDDEQRRVRQPLDVIQIQLS
jgi:hypothetical protein